jgi:hypothetical protein
MIAIYIDCQSFFFKCQLDNDAIILKKKEHIFKAKYVLLLSVFLLYIIVYFYSYGYIVI